jgi:signal transduction histidine kinase
MASKDRILHINDYMLDFLKDEYGNLPPGNLKSLSRLYPDLAALIPDFEASKASVFNQPMLLGRQQMRHNVQIQKLGGVTSKFLITAQPDLPAPGDAAATLAWADTARRLSHNVRRHITNIILALKPLQTGGLDDKQLGYTDIIRSEIEKIRIFTHAFQRFTELKDYELKLQDVIPSLEHCLERLTIPTGIKLIKNWDLASVEAWIEPIRFEEALGNVIANALDAMVEGGILHLSVKKFPNHSGLNGRQSVMIEVEDSGKGIPAKYLEEVWQPFFTTKNDGTGIGLPETRKIITSMGGTVLVQSEEGVGTVVTFWLKGSADG